MKVSLLSLNTIFNGDTIPKFRWPGWRAFLRYPLNAKFCKFYPPTHNVITLDQLHQITCGEISGCLNRQTIVQLELVHTCDLGKAQAVFFSVTLDKIHIITCGVRYLSTFLRNNCFWCNYQN